MDTGDHERPPASERFVVRGGDASERAGVEEGDGREVEAQETAAGFEVTVEHRPQRRRGRHVEIPGDPHQRVLPVEVDRLHRHSVGGRRIDLSPRRCGHARPLPGGAPPASSPAESSTSGQKRRIKRVAPDPTRACG
jgi:hypothetical protein